MNMWFFLFLVFGLIGVYLLIKGVLKFQVRDKRYNKGVKNKFNWKSIRLIIFSLFLIMISLYFYNLYNL